MLTTEQGNAILTSLDDSYSIILAKAKANVSDIANHRIVDGILTIFSVGAEYQRENLLRQQLETVQMMGDQIQGLRDMLPGAVADEEMGNRWIDAAKNFEQRLREAAPDLEITPVTQILRESINTAAGVVKSGVEGVVSTIPKLLPAWLIVLIVGGVGAYFYFRFRRA
jgi:hypothetical protein